MCGNKKDDRHEEHVWLMEPSIPRGHNVLTPAGADNIAQHKYKSGVYTPLDNFFSANVWGPITNSFPMWLAPNLVTMVGGMFCLMSFLVSNAYIPESANWQLVEVPRWLFAFNGLCHCFYFTLDGCDGKQARRTNSSTPLGQLFDHGMDCLVTLNHLQWLQCFLQFPPHLAIFIQVVVQYSFWLAQWEEFYTGILPHSTFDGKVGVTELNYGIALWSIGHSLFGRGLYDIILIETPPSFVEQYWTGENQPFQVKHAFALYWCVLVPIVFVSVPSWMRVHHHLNSNNKGYLFFSAMSKLVSPLLLVIVGVWGLTDSVKARSNVISLGLGMCFCMITIKLIVFGMARMAYASIQMDILPLVIVAVYAKFNKINDPVLFQVLDCWYLLRLLYWTHQAIQQLCERLNIQLFRIPYQKGE